MSSPSTRSSLRGFAIAATCTAAMVVNSSNNTSLAIALPTIGHSFRASSAVLQWFVSAYPLSSGCLLLLCGHLADNYGRKRVLVVGSAILAAFTLGCGFTKHAVVLAVLRALQGIGGAATIPAAIGILAHEFPPSSPRARAAAFSSFSAGAPIGGALGMILGGLVTELSKYTWQAQFWLSAALAFATLFAAILFIPADPPASPSAPSPSAPSPTTHKSDAEAQTAPTYPPPSSPALPRRVRRVVTDWPGVLLSTTGLVLLVFVLGQGAGPGVPPPGRSMMAESYPQPPVSVRAYSIPPWRRHFVPEGVEEDFWRFGPPPPPPYGLSDFPPPPHEDDPFSNQEDGDETVAFRDATDAAASELTWDIDFDDEQEMDGFPHPPPHGHGPPPGFEREHKHPPPPPHHRHHHHGPPPPPPPPSFVSWLFGAPPPSAALPRTTTKRPRRPGSRHPFPLHDLNYEHGSHQSSMQREWGMPHIISLLVLSIILLVSFVLWEVHLEAVHSRPGGMYYSASSAGVAALRTSTQSSRSTALAPGPAPSQQRTTAKDTLSNTRWGRAIRAYVPPPLMRPSLFGRARGRVGAVYAVVFFQFAGFMIWAYWVQIYYQIYIGYSPVRTVVRLVPMFVTGIICNVVVALIVGRVSTGWLLSTGTLCTTLAPFLFALIVPSAPYWAFGFPASILAVIGADFLFAAGMMFVSNAVGPGEQSLAGGVFQTMAQVGTSLGVTVSTIVLDGVAERIKRHGSGGSWSGGAGDGLPAYHAANWAGVAFGAVACVVAVGTERDREEGQATITATREERPALVGDVALAADKDEEQEGEREREKAPGTAAAAAVV
ncbi:MFS domain-containing protein [Mycena kentingensis (nom. inval.)]|nr:MFS domain-containing protein [Mycena kentingensis (nom. inval.)]